MKLVFIKSVCTSTVLGHSTLHYTLFTHLDIRIRFWLVIRFESILLNTFQ